MECAFANVDPMTKISSGDLARARQRLLRMHFESGVGHIGGNLSCIDAMLVVLSEYVRTDDTFVLSKGHSAGALYTALWAMGRLSDEELRTFHKDGTRLPGHPPISVFPEIAFATGSLGHGLSLAAGTALAYRLRNRASRVYCLTSDGEWQEGSTWEALIFAAHQRLANLTVLIDHNGLQGFGDTDTVASMDPLWDKFQGFNVDVQVVDGHDIDQIRNALDRKAQTLSIIVLKTTKGHGVSFMEDQMEWHYLPLSGPQFAQALSEVDC